MQGLSFRSPVLVCAAAVLLSACAAIPPQAVESYVPAPIVEIPADNAPRLDTYTVKAGDTLIRIGLDSGQNPADIARWNGLSDPGKNCGGPGPAFGTTSTGRNTTGRQANTYSFAQCAAQ